MKTNTDNQDTDKKVKKDNPEQSQQFVETAKALESDESGQSFNKAISKIKKSSS